jgi:hypothetical protein
VKEVPGYGTFYTFLEIVATPWLDTLLLESLDETRSGRSSACVLGAPEVGERRVSDAEVIDAQTQPPPAGTRASA